MEITQLGEYCFRVKTKTGITVFEPEERMGGVSADLVVWSQGEGKVKMVGTTRRKEPFVVKEPGEYEVEGVSIFGYPASEGAIYLLQVEEVRVLYLGKLATSLSDKQLEPLADIDVLIVGVQGENTKYLGELVKTIEPYLLLPAGKLVREELQQELGLASREVESLAVSSLALNGEATEMVFFRKES